MNIQESSCSVAHLPHLFAHSVYLEKKIGALLFTSRTSNSQLRCTFVHFAHIKFTLRYTFVHFAHIEFAVEVHFLHFAHLGSSLDTLLRTLCANMVITSIILVDSKS